MTTKDATTLEDLRREAAERAKELRCLYEVFRATEDAEGPTAAVLQRVADLLPPAFLFAEDAMARVRCAGLVVSTPGFTETPWMLSSPVTLGERTGELTVAYRAEHPPAGEGPFLPEERELLDAVARRVREVLARAEERKAQASRAQFTALVFEHVSDAIGLLDLEAQRFVEFNTAAHASLGYDRETFARLASRHFLDTPPEVREAAREQLLRTGTVQAERRLHRSDGTQVDVLVSGKRVELDGRRYLAVVWTDITAAKALQESLERRNRQLRAISEAIKQVVFAPTEAELLQGVCAAIAASGGYLSAWVGLALDDEAKTVRPVAAAGPHADYARGLRVSWSDQVPEGLGPTGRCLREGAPVVLRSASTDPSFAPWREAAKAHGFGSSIALPLLTTEAGPARAALMFYSGREDAFDAAEVELLQGLADAVSFGIRAARERVARSELQARAEATARRLGNLLEASPVIVYTLARRGDRLVPLEVSDNASRLLGYEVETLLEEDFWFSHLHPDERDQVFRRAARVLLGERVSQEFRVRHADGRWLWVSDDVRPTFDATGQVDGAVGAWSDVTDRRATDERLRKLTLAVEQNPESIAITDRGGRIEYVNDAFCVNTGYSREELVGQNPRVLQSGRTPREVYTQMWATLEAGKPWKGEFINRKKDGTEYVESAILAPIRNDAGETTHYLAIKHDITETMRMAEELRHHRRNLEELVARRTAELAEARERAEAASLAKSAFLANMSHEIRTPMNAIIGYTHLLRRADPTPAQADRLRKIDASARHLLELINDILDLSKVEAGRMTVERVAFDPKRVLDEVFELLRQRADEKGLLLSSDVDAALPDGLVGDPLRLRQVLLNLGSNAVKFTEQGRVALRVRVEKHDEANALVRFEVEDTGIGMTAAQLERLFSAFEQGDASTTRTHGGTGLGLAISKSLVGLMGGEISTVSQAGVGSTFTVTLPFGVVSRLPRSSDSDLRAAALTGRRALLAVADDHMRERLKVELEEIGLRVEATASAGEAKALLEGAARSADPVDFLLMPWPPDAALQPVASAGAASVAIALVSPRAAPSVDELARAGFLASLPLPVQRSTLQASLSGFLARRGRAAAVRILLVEDDPMNQEVARELLASRGYQVDVANNGAEALVAVERQAYELVLMDLQMPVMDGLTATRELRRTSAGARVPIVAMTASAFGDDRERGLAVGMSDFITKPVEPERLFRAVERWTRAGEAAPPVPSAPRGLRLPAEGDLLQALEELPGLDVRAGLHYLKGDQRTYARLLGRYVETRGDDVRLLREALAQGRLEDAVRIAHTLKGLAATLGAVAVNVAARQVEATLRSNDRAGSDAHLAALEAAHGALVSRLRERLPAAAPAPLGPPREEFDWAAARSSVARLLDLLAHDDVRATTEWQALAPALAPALGGRATALARHITGFEFDRAYAELREAVEAEPRFRAARPTAAKAD